MSLWLAQAIRVTLLLDRQAEIGLAGSAPLVFDLRYGCKSVATELAFHGRSARKPLQAWEQVPSKSPAPGQGRGGLHRFDAGSGPGPSGRRRLGHSPVRPGPLGLPPALGGRGRAQRKDLCRLHHRWPNGGSDAGRPGTADGNQGGFTVVTDRGSASETNLNPVRDRHHDYLVVRDFSAEPGPAWAKPGTPGAPGRSRPWDTPPDLPALRAGKASGSEPLPAANQGRDPQARIRNCAPAGTRGSPGGASGWPGRRRSCSGPRWRPGRPAGPAAGSPQSRRGAPAGRAGPARPRG